MSSFRYIGTNLFAWQINGIEPRSSQEAVLEDGKGGNHQREQEDEEGEVEEGNGRLSLSTSVLGALCHGVAIQVALVGARVASDGDGQGGSTGKGENEIEEVPDG
ncbi:hypothetical protein KL905_004687 [Ogataea polymorpha]|nr:hypothetical protein KL906_002019 [Ogataea polymorpha]KAG7916284.1 hypothetical protein KL905_004687 [Ogataea polymorpha]